LPPSVSTRSPPSWTTRSRRPETNFDVQSLGGVKQYLGGYLSFQQRRGAEKVRKAARKEAEQVEARTAYDHFRRTQAVDLFLTLPVGEREVIETMARASAAKFSGSLQDRMFELGKVRFTIGRHGEKLKTYDQWQETELS
jgi:hypothetical protein